MSYLRDVFGSSTSGSSYTSGNPNIDTTHRGVEYGNYGRYGEGRRASAIEIIKPEELRRLLRQFDILDVDADKDKALASIKIVQKLINMIDDVPRLIVLQSCFKELGMFDELQYLMNSKMFRGDKYDRIGLSKRDIDNLDAYKINDDMRKLQNQIDRIYDNNRHYDNRVGVERVVYDHRANREIENLKDKEEKRKLREKLEAQVIEDYKINKAAIETDKQRKLIAIDSNSDLTPENKQTKRSEVEAQSKTKFDALREKRESELAKIKALSGGSRMVSQKTKKSKKPISQSRRRRSKKSHRRIVRKNRSL